MLSLFGKSLIFLVSFITVDTLVDGAGVTYQGGAGPGRGKHIVLVAGDDAEYHSEEALPALRKFSPSARIYLHGAFFHQSE